MLLKLHMTLKEELLTKALESALEALNGTYPSVEDKAAKAFKEPSIFNDN